MYLIKNNNLAKVILLSPSLENNPKYKELDLVVKKLEDHVQVVHSRHDKIVVGDSFVSLEMMLSYLNSSVRSPSSTVTNVMGVKPLVKLTGMFRTFDLRKGKESEDSMYEYLATEAAPETNRTQL